MKKIAIFCCLVLCLLSCKKDKTNSDDPNNSSTQIDITADQIWLDPYKFGNGWDTTGNYVATHEFDFNHDTKADYIATTNPADQNYYLKYIPTTPLLSPDSVIYNNGEMMEFPINNLLKGQLLFEVYNASTNQVVKRIHASNDSCKIRASFSIWANMSITPAQIREAFHYYLTTKQTPSIKYYNIKD